jgi:hypothetical protein
LQESGLQYICSKLHEITLQNKVSKSDLPDDICELLTETLSILYKVVSRLGSEHAQLIQNVIVKEVFLNELQLLLGVKHNVLLRCVFECLLTLFEWVNRNQNN